MMMMMMMMMMTTVITLMMTTLALMICLLGAFENLFWLVLFWIVEFLAQLLPVNRTYCNDNRGPKIDTQFTNFCTFFCNFYRPTSQRHSHVPHATAKKNKLRPPFFYYWRFQKTVFSALPALSTLRNLSKANSFTAPKTEQEDPRCPNFQIFQNFRNFGDFFFGLKSSNFSLLSSDRARIRRVLDDTEKIAQKFDTMSSNEPPQVDNFRRFCLKEMANLMRSVWGHN